MENCKGPVELHNLIILGLIESFLFLDRMTFLTDENSTILQPNRNARPIFKMFN